MGAMGRERSVGAWNTPDRRIALVLAITGLTTAVILLGFVAAYGLWDVGWWSVLLLTAPAGVGALIMRADRGVDEAGRPGHWLSVIVLVTAFALLLIPLIAFGDIPRYVLDDPTPALRGERVTDGRRAGVERREWLMVIGVVGIIIFTWGGWRRSRSGARAVEHLVAWATVGMLISWCPFMLMVGLGTGLSSPPDATLSDGVRGYLPVLAHVTVPALAIVAGHAGRGAGSTTDPGSVATAARRPGRAIDHAGSPDAH